MNKKKILFDISGHDTWIGGVYYMRNIIYQICNNPDLLKICQPIIVYSTKFRELFSAFQDRAKLLEFEDNNKVQRLLMLCKALKEADKIYYYHQYKFDPVNYLEKKAIYWIPDFQECYYPQFFEPSQIEFRKNRGNRAMNMPHDLVLSSQSCLDDFNLFFGKKQIGNVYVVPFVSAIENELIDLSEEYCHEILKKHSLREYKYVLVSNQFWQHKNHIVVFEAIKLAVSTGRLCDYFFVFTGELKDYRNSNYYQQLLDITKQNEIAANMKILGFINRKEQLALMKKAYVVLQPSLFEGWGTVVEDAKVLDKTIVLSDISVHREQMNNKCHLFDPNSPESLIQVLENVVPNNEIEDYTKGIENMKHSAIIYSRGLIELFNK